MNNKRFILGTVQLGTSYGINNSLGKPTKETAFDILHFANEQGIDQLDSAELYGSAQELIGEFIQAQKVKFLVNSKFKVSSERSIRSQLYNTLEQLNLERLNVYFYHRFGEMISTPESLVELATLKKEGLINKVGVSVYNNVEFEICIEKEEIDVIQVPFNLLDNFSKRGKLLRKAKSMGKELQVRSVFLQGLFFKEETSFPPVLEPLLKYVRKLKELALEYNMSMQDLALGYVLCKSEVDAIIIGIDSKEQLTSNLSTQDAVLNIDLVDKVDSIIVEEEELLYPYNWK